MTPIYQALLESMGRPGFEIAQDAENGRAWLEYDGEAGTWLLVGEAHEDLELAAVSAVLRGRVRPERRDAVALLLTRINFELLLGAFTMDLSDGEVRYRAAAPVGADPAAQIDALIGACVSAPERWLAQIEQTAA